MWNRVLRGRAFGITVHAILAIVVALAIGGSTQAEDGEWTVRFESVFMEAYGHDQHVLTVRESDFDPTPQVERQSAVNLDTDSGFAYRGEFQYTRGPWGAGVDFLWFNTTQNADRRTAAADGPSGTIDEISFEIADRDFTSTDPSEVLFFEILEDTDLIIWTADLYGIRTLADRPQSSIRLLFGLRVGDFDNDYRAVVGEQGVDGVFLAASSNYGLMMGPLVGLAGDLRRGNNHIEGYLGQSLLIGDAELTSTFNEFTGPVATPLFVAREELRGEQDAAIPVTEFRLKWSYRVSKRIAVGLGANTSVWRDVPVPPGVIPGDGGDGVFHENTIVFFGMLGSVEVTF